MVEYLDEGDYIIQDEEIKKLNIYFQNIMLPKSLRIFSIIGYNLYEFDMFVNDFNNDIIILNYKLLNEKLGKVIHFDIVFEFNKGKDVKSRIFIKYYKLEKNTDIFKMIDKFNKLLLRDKKLMVSFEYYLMKYHNKIIN